MLYTGVCVVQLLFQCLCILWRVLVFRRRTTAISQTWSTLHARFYLPFSKKKIMHKTYLYHLIFPHVTLLSFPWGLYLANFPFLRVCIKFHLSSLPVLLCFRIYLNHVCTLLPWLRWREPNLIFSKCVESYPQTTDGDNSSPHVYTPVSVSDP